MNEILVVPDSETAVCANHLLAGLAGANRQRVLASCEVVAVQLGQVLMRPGLRSTHAWFPLDAIVSLGIAAGERAHSFEVGLVGPEGMVGIPLLLGSSDSSLRATVVRQGAALRIAAAPLRLQLRSGEAFRERMQQYVLVTLTHLAQAALCTRYHRVEERLARWLLMTQDRAPLGPVHATHEFLAAALGVRRAGITRAAATLQRRQLIAYHRGVLTVLDRVGLQAAACGCYAADCASYADGMQWAALA
ncbi:MAG TPA: Crp/Fnr family transcriptional regulator [Ramlibacter sp.]|nr:Crp/Fnr family transcriptional regulator [Ramlibacter sp.]